MSYNTRLEDLIDHHFISDERLIKKKQMGGVGYLINGNMCIGIYEQYLVVRIGRSLAHALINRPGINRFVSEDSSQDDFVMVDEKVYSNPKALAKFLSSALDYTLGLPPVEGQADDP